MVLSVLVTVYNCEQYLDQCLQSLVSQTFTDFELLISDDASGDASLEICRRYARTDPRISIFSQPDNLGSIGNMNFLLGRAQGEFVTLHDSDDWSDTDRLEKQMAVLQSPQKPVLSGTGGAYHYPNGAVRKEQAEPTRYYQGIREPFPSTPASVVFKKDILKKTVGLHPFFRGGSATDRYFLMEILEGETAHHLNEPLYHANISKNSEHRGYNEWKMTSHFLFEELEAQRKATGTDWLKENNLAAIGAFLEKVGRNRKLMSEKYREYACYQIDTDETALAAELLKKAFRTYPGNARILKTLKYYLKQKYSRR